MDAYTILLLLAGAVAGWIMCEAKHGLVRLLAAARKRFDSIEPFTPETPPVLDTPPEREEPEPEPGPEPPTISNESAIQNGPEAEEREVKATIAGTRDRLSRLTAMSPGETGGLDLQSEIDEATREYGNAYFAYYKKAPPEWGGDYNVPK